MPKRTFVGSTSAGSAVAASTAPMKIAFLAWRDLAHPLAGGSEVLVDHLARGLVERGHEVDLLCGGPTASRSYSVTSAGGTYTQYLRVPLRCLAAHRRADLVVDVANGVPYFTPLWRRGPSLCLVNHVHTDHWALWFPEPLAALGRGLETRVVPALYRRSLFAAVSPSTVSALVDLGVPADHIRIVNNGVEAPDEQPEKSAEPLFLAIGRMVPHKRFDTLVRLWESVRPVTGGRLVIVGEGPERQRLAAMAGPGVELPGWVTEAEKQRLLGSAWLLVHPAAVEGWGLVVMEAAARETPTVGFDVPGVRDSVVDGRSGVLARSENELVGAWTKLAADGLRRHAMGGWARARAREFSWSSTVDRFLEVAAEARTWGGVVEPGARSGSQVGRQLVP